MCETTSLSRISETTTSTYGSHHIIPIIVCCCFPSSYSRTLRRSSSIAHVSPVGENWKLQSLHSIPGHPLHLAVCSSHAHLFSVTTSQFIIISANETVNWKRRCCALGLPQTICSVSNAREDWIRDTTDLKIIETTNSVQQVIRLTSSFKVRQKVCRKFVTPRKSGPKFALASTLSHSSNNTCL